MLAKTKRPLMVGFMASPPTQMPVAPAWYGFKYRVGIACFYDEKPTHWQSRWRYWTAVWRREPHCSLMQVLEVDLVLGGQPRSTRTGTEAGHLPLALNVG